MLKKFVRDHKVHKGIVSSIIFDFLFLCKPVYLLGPVGMLLSGMYLSNFSNSNLELGLTSVNLTTFLFTLGFSFIISCIFIKSEILNINQDSTRFHFIEENTVGKTVSIEAANLVHNILLGIGCVLILTTAWTTFFIIVAVYFLWLYAINYSSDLLKSVCLFTAISFFILFSGWLYSDSSLNSYLNVVLFLLLSTPYLCLFLTTIVLINFDSSRINSAIALVLIFFGFFTAYYNNDPVGTTSLAVSLPFYLFLFIRGTEKDLIRAIRYPIFLLNFFLFTVYPLSIIPMSIIYYMSKYYYWHRFDKHFPALAINNDYS